MQTRKKVWGRPPLAISIELKPVSPTECPPGQWATNGLPRKHRPCKRRPTGMKRHHSTRSSRYPEHHLATLTKATFTTMKDSPQSLYAECADGS
ncbi:Hypothetical predicted protein [Pelobates cultripes]|uniref:Uncharacterized protein n=1 Tax=Pelobates cultripes TaxID=61616 RepID=A0AAD1SHL9_PELCU|nr:Hypothetical predicted protein [Pelobates cultripes]